MATLSATPHLPRVAKSLPHFDTRRRLAEYIGALRTTLRPKPSTPRRARPPRPPGRERFLENAVMAREMSRL